MCELCNEEGPTGCQNCGRLICFDIEKGDDVIRPAFVTSSGDLYCDECGREMEREEEKMMEEDDLWYGTYWDCET